MVNFVQKNAKKVTEEVDFQKQLNQRRSELMERNRSFAKTPVLI